MSRPQNRPDIAAAVASAGVARSSVSCLKGGLGCLMLLLPLALVGYFVFAAITSTGHSNRPCSSSSCSSNNNNSGGGSDGGDGGDGGD